MDIRYYRLKDIAKIKSGKRLPAGHIFSDDPTSHPYIRARDIKNRRIQTSDLVYLKEDTYQAIKKYIIEKGDVAMTIVANIGDVGYCAEDCHKANLTENAVRLTQFDKEIVDSKYLAFYLGQSFMKVYMESLAAGAAQAKLGIYKIEKIKVPLPGINTQRRIASILSVYDNLIENNNKRIRLLEQMAENLYKEWFVRFRFPGHENAEFENGLPKGWSKSPLSEICEFKRGKNITSDEMCEGNIPVISAGIDVSGYHNKSNVKGVSVTMSSSGANAGYISIHYKSIWAADCSYIEETTTDNIYYAYELLNNMRVVITNFQRGAAQPHVYPRDINRIKVIVPNKGLMAEANKRLAVFHQEIHHLQKQSALLSRQRDLLLPRLMSGKIEVNV